MNKLAVLFAILLASGLVTVRLIDFPNGTTAHNRDICEEFVRYHCFKRAFEVTIDELANGELSLKRACARTHGLADAHHPNYIAFLSLAELGATDEERVARNLVAHVRACQEWKPTSRQPLPRLEAELQSYLSEIHSRASAP
jgi:hypothetical protein